MWRTTGVFVAFFPPKNSAAMTFSHSMLDATPLSWEMAGTRTKYKGWISDVKSSWITNMWENQQQRGIWNASAANNCHNSESSHFLQADSLYWYVYIVYIYIISAHLFFSISGLLAQCWCCRWFWNRLCLLHWRTKGIWRISGNGWEWTMTCYGMLWQRSFAPSAPGWVILDICSATDSASPCFERFEQEA